MKRTRLVRILGVGLVLAACFSFPNVSLAQTAEDELGSWFMYFGQNRIGKRSSLHTEAQLRFWELGQDYNQLLLRVGYNWDINEKNMATGGYAFIETSPFEDNRAESREHRLWQQYIQRAQVGRVGFEHRFRLEERWIDSGLRNDFKMRFRYRILLNIAIANPETSKFLFSIYDEIFLGIEDDPFDQNRLYGAFGYKISKISMVQFGYLLNTFSDENLGRLQFAWVYNPDLRKKDKRK